MEPIVIPTLAAIISAAVGGAAGEAGKSAWASLTALVRRLLGHDREAVEAVERPDAHSPDELARLLADRAAADPGFGRSLAAWMARAEPAARTVNTISGDVSGNVVQAGDIHGSINFGDPRR
ncbi:hypothetical protein AB0K60_33615 [Thermopolyspora sp. NPDC052614]|uniref:hypothetical protein n=1 Tax=Thermopolyspora sp. NPDC052614 TaxID=3155682 RepID=UPI00343D251E